MPPFPINNDGARAGLQVKPMLDRRTQSVREHHQDEVNLLEPIHNIVIVLIYHIIY